MTPPFQRAARLYAVLVILLLVVNALGLAAVAFLSIFSVVFHAHP